MKKIGVFIVLALLLINLTCICLAEDTPSVPDSSQEMQSIQQATNQIPLDEQGQIDPTKVAGFKSKAELRIDAINAWLVKTDKYFLWLFGIPLRLSWQFSYLFFLILISLSLFHNIPYWFNSRKEIINILIGVVVTLALGYFRGFLWLISWIIAITNKWWWNYAVVGGLLILTVVSGALFVILRKSSDKRREKSDREKLHEGARSAEHMEKVDEALSEGLRG